MEIEIFEPGKYDDAQEYVHKLQNGTAVILKYDFIDSAIVRMIHDFMIGCIYALDGSVYMVGDNVVLYAPKNFLVEDRSLRKNIPGEVKTIFYSDFGK